MTTMDIWDIENIKELMNDCSHITDPVARSRCENPMLETIMRIEQPALQTWGPDDMPSEEITTMVSRTATPLKASVSKTDHPMLALGLIPRRR